jgi:dTDP-4-amino-4,6-dideoxygalactose transaminase
VALFGFNSRLDNLHAAVLNFKLSRYDAEVGRRRELARRYHDGLHDLPELLLPPAPDADADHFDVFQNYEIEAERRDELKRYLEQRGVRTILQWGGKMVHQFKALGLDFSLPRTDRISERFLLLPLHTALQDGDVDHICALIRDFYGKG